MYQDEMAVKKHQCEGNNPEMRDKLYCDILLDKVATNNTLLQEITIKSESLSGNQQEKCEVGAELKLSNPLNFSESLMSELDRSRSLIIQIREDLSRFI